jgi:hypothetical protein
LKRRIALRSADQDADLATTVELDAAQPLAAEEELRVVAQDRAQVQARSSGGSA